MVEHHHERDSRGFDSNLVLESHLRNDHGCRSFQTDRETMMGLHDDHHRLARARKLLQWVLDEADLSGMMELDHAIRGWLAKEDAPG